MRQCLAKTRTKHSNQRVTAMLHSAWCQRASSPHRQPRTLDAGISVALHKRPHRGHRGNPAQHVREAHDGGPMLADRHPRHCRRVEGMEGVTGRLSALAAGEANQDTTPHTPREGGPESSRCNAHCQ